MPGSPPPFEKRTVTRLGSSCMCAALVSPDPFGVNVPAMSVPFAWAARWPGWRPEMSLIASTTSDASGSMCVPKHKSDGRSKRSARAASPVRRQAPSRYRDCNVRYELARLRESADDRLVEPLAHRALGPLDVREPAQ